MAAADSHDPMQRVRVGLTGLAFVLLIVALVSVVFGAASDEKPVMPQSDLANMMMPMAPADGNAAVEAEKPADPIAELGVAPSSATTDANNSETVVPPPVQPTLPPQGRRR